MNSLGLVFYYGVKDEIWLVEFPEGCLHEISCNERFVGYLNDEGLVNFVERYKSGLTLIGVL